MIYMIINLFNATYFDNTGHLQATKLMKMYHTIALFRVNHGDFNITFYKMYVVLSLPLLLWLLKLWY
jgi:ABC-type glucose/galactose transport system permease subunit